MDEEEEEAVFDTLRENVEALIQDFLEETNEGMPIVQDWALVFASQNLDHADPRIIVIDGITQPQYRTVGLLDVVLDDLKLSAIDRHDVEPD